MKPPRTKYEVLPMTLAERKSEPGLLDQRWKVTKDGQRIFAHKTKGPAVAYAITHARMRLAAGHLGTLKIKGLKGRIQDERTYGNDPRESKG